MAPYVGASDSGGTRRTGTEWVVQNEFLLNAFRFGISSKLTLLRGDIDHVLITDSDDFGKSLIGPLILCP